MHTYLSLILILCLAAPASALTNHDAGLTWAPTTDATIRYEFRWAHFDGWTWEPITADVDSTLGRYMFNFPALADSAGDRGACFDARAYRTAAPTIMSAWVSEGPTGAACVQIPNGVMPTPMPVPVPVPAPAPVPTPEPAQTPIPDQPATVTLRGDQVFIACDPARYTRIKTTGTGTKRTLTCLK